MVSVKQDPFVGKREFIQFRVFVFLIKLISYKGKTQKDIFCTLSTESTSYSDHFLKPFSFVYVEFRS